MSHSLKEFLNLKWKVYLYKTPWIYLKRSDYKERIKKYSIALPGKKTNLCLEGYPSSGNSWAYNLIIKFNPNIIISTHYHNVVSLKLANKYNVPVVIIIRNPAEAISSRIARFGNEITRSILEYIEFHKYVYSNINKFTVISFDELIDNTEETLNIISKKTGIEFVYQDMNLVKKEIKREMEEFMVSNNEPPEKRGFPNDQKDIQKNKIKNQLIRNRYWNDALEIYSTINRYPDNES